MAGDSYRRIEWPQYRQCTLDLPFVAIVCLVFSVMAALALALLRIRLRWYHWFLVVWIGYTVAWIPALLVEAVNWPVRLRWWRKIGRVASWRQVQEITKTAPGPFELLVRRQFRGSMSFGTYHVMGGGNAFLLHDRSDGVFWAVRGGAPRNLTTIGLSLVEVNI